MYMQCICIVLPFENMTCMQYSYIILSHEIQLKVSYWTQDLSVCI